MGIRLSRQPPALSDDEVTRVRAYVRSERRWYGLLLPFGIVFLAIGVCGLAWMTISDKFDGDSLLVALAFAGGGALLTSIPIDLLRRPPVTAREQLTSISGRLERRRSGPRRMAWFIGDREVDFLEPRLPWDLPSGTHVTAEVLHVPSVLIVRFRPRSARAGGLQRS